MTVTAAVILPGMDGTSEFLVDFAKELGKYCRVLKVAYPEDRPLDYPALIEIVRPHLPTDEPHFIIGESFSGPIALCIAAENPKNLVGTVLCCSFARSPGPGLGALSWLSRNYPSRFIPTALVGFLILGRWFTPERRMLLSTIIRRIPSSVWASRLRSMANIDLSSIKGRISTPVLYLAATEDRLVGKAEIAYLKELIPQLQEYELEAPHFLLEVQPAKAAEKIAGFVDLKLNQTPA